MKNRRGKWSVILVLIAGILTAGLLALSGLSEFWSVSIAVILFPSYMADAYFLNR